jgi:oligopeptide transport system substrate-binding protein
MDKKTQTGVTRREFLTTAGAISAMAAAGSAIPFTLFASGCPSGGAPAGEQVLRVNLASEPAQIDPNRASWAQELTIIRQCFQGVLGFNQDLTLRAETATQIPSVANGGISADGKTYTFKLKNNVTWSDGQKVTAKDYVYSIKRMLDPALAAEYASFYYSIAGAEDYNGGKGSADAVGVRAVDDYTLELKLVAAQPTFLQIMALWPSYPVRQDIIAAQGEKWTEPPNYIGNGPFMLTEWVHQDHLTFKQNPNYWGTKPKLTEITLKDVADPNAELASYRNGELEFSRVPTGTESTFMSDPDLHRYAELTTFAWRFNLKVPPWDNINVRKGISCAVDRGAFVNQVRSGVGKPATSWIPPACPVTTPTWARSSILTSPTPRNIWRTPATATSANCRR